jgi:hypothetical protein
MLDVIRRISQHREKDNIKFLITARIPDLFNIINNISSASSNIPSEYVVPILPLINDKNNIYRIPKFSVAETAEYLSKYKNNQAPQGQSQEKAEAENLNNETNGNAFLIMFCLTNQSRESHKKNTK